jgi:hypothetical protein
LDELKNDMPLNTHVISSSFRALKTWKPTFSMTFNVSQTMKHPCLTRGWISHIHTFAKDVMSNKGMYILLNAQAFRLLNNEVQNGGGTKV